MRVRPASLCSFVTVRRARRKWGWGWAAGHLVLPYMLPGGAPEEVGPLLQEVEALFQDHRWQCATSIQQAFSSANYTKVLRPVPISCPPPSLASYFTLNFLRCTLFADCARGWWSGGGRGGV